MLPTATMIGTDISISLGAVARQMGAAQDRWWIIGSAAVALHGADPGPVAGIDVLLSVADAHRILPTIGIAPVAGVADARFRSRVFGVWDGTASPVEFMAGLECRTGDTWLPVRPATRSAVAVGGGIVHVPDRGELGSILVAFGRPKDLARTARLMPDRMVE